ncbi:MAG: hypothetical protein LUD41_07290 [Phascolarctobacterium sp.]|nr:hypothetical protein [Phascolarctobacterium sp.]
MYSENMYESIERKTLQQLVQDMLGELKQREREIVCARFAFEDGREKALEEVGQIYGLTKEHIRQIEKKALRKLAHPVRKKKLEGFL